MIEKLRTIVSRTHFEKSIMIIRFCNPSRERNTWENNWLGALDYFYVQSTRWWCFHFKSVGDSSEMCAVAHTQYSSFGSGYVSCFFKTFLLLLLFNCPCCRLLTLKFLSANMNLETQSDDLGGAVDCKWSRSPHLIKLRLRNLFIISWNSDFSFDDENSRRIFPVGTREFQMIYSKLLSKFYKIIVKKQNRHHIILWRKDFHIEIWRWR